MILNEDFNKLYKAFCPGPITFILKKKKKSSLASVVVAGKNTVAVRFPKHKVARKLLNIIKFPLAAPSANISSKLSPTSAKDVLAYGALGKLGHDDTAGIQAAFDAVGAIGNRVVFFPKRISV